MSLTIAPRERAQSLIDQSVRKALGRTSGKPRRTFLEFLNDVRGRSDLLRLNGRRGGVEPDWLDDFLGGLLTLSRNRGSWIRPVDGWRPQGAGPIGLFSSLAHHLLTEHPTPPVLLSAWFSGDAWDARRQRGWFMRAGRGVSLREVGFPLPLTRRAAHLFAGAPARFPISFALRWAQVRGMGGSDPLARAVASTRLGGSFLDQDFWAGAIRFLVDHPALDPTAIGLVVEYLHHQKFAPRWVVVGEDEEVMLDAPQPDLSLKGWTADSLMRRALAWEARRKKGVARTVLRWERSTIGEFAGMDEEGRSWSIRELLDSDDLAAEGKAMRHCAATYTNQCANRRTTVWSMRVEQAGSLMRVATVEVDPENREVVQAKARSNEEPDEPCRKVLERWAEREGLKINPRQE